MFKLERDGKIPFDTKPLEITIAEGQVELFGGNCTLIVCDIELNAIDCNIAFNASTGRWDVDISEVMAPGPGNVYLRDSYTSADAAMEAVRKCYE